jgi:peptidoglycan/LPS O-acetylase OafA/YrhL
MGERTSGGTHDRGAEEVVVHDQRPEERYYIPTLDGWRAFAICVVMLQHGADQITDFFGDWIEPLTDVFKQNGRFGVYTFFAISGYLICSRLLNEETRRGSIDLKSFYIRRVFRIVPPYFTYLAVIGILTVMGILSVPLGKWLSAFLFIHNYWLGGSWYMGHLWSLAIEEHFYIIWPILLFWLGRSRSLRAGFAIIIGVSIWRFIDLAFGVTAGSSIRFDDRTDVHFDGLMWGCVFAILCLDAGNRQRIAALTAGWRYWVIAVVLVITQVVNAENPLIQSVQLAARPMFVATLVVGTVVCPWRRYGRLLELRWLRWLGRISYSLYLWQQLFLVWDGFDVPELSKVQVFPISFACALACAVLSYKFIELPMMAIGRRKVEARERRRALAASPAV